MKTRQVPQRRLSARSAGRQIKCHTVQSDFARKSLKTKKTAHNQVTHFFEVDDAEKIAAAEKIQPPRSEV
jgi:hypothetical protein